MKRTIICLIPALALGWQSAAGSGGQARGPVIPQITNRIAGVRDVAVWMPDGRSVAVLTGPTNWVCVERTQWARLADMEARLSRVTERLEALTRSDEEFFQRNQAMQPGRPWAKTPQFSRANLPGPNRAARQAATQAKATLEEQIERMRLLAGLPAKPYKPWWEKSKRPGED